MPPDGAISVETVVLLIATFTYSSVALALALARSLAGLALRFLVLLSRGAGNE